MADAIAKNSTRDLWTEVKKVRGSGKLTTNRIDDAIGPKNICDVFMNKFKSLYNEVSYEKQEMNSVMSKVDKLVTEECMSNKCRGCHCINLAEVTAAVHTLKKGKSDGVTGC